ncbi:MAG: SEC-C metal-binding domain-containing protein, partial [Waddliaceae bacterium]
TDELAQKGAEKVIRAFKERLEYENSKLAEIASTEAVTPSNPAEAALRHIMIHKIDQHWQEHLLTMDHLRSDVNMRAVGQRDPLMEFKHEAFRLFDLLRHKIQEEITHDLFRFEIRAPDHPGIEQLLSHLQMERNRSFLDDSGEQIPQPDMALQTSSMEFSESPSPEQRNEKPRPVTVLPKIGRNDPCPCGSGKKYKKCCGILRSEQNYSLFTLNI